ncbi:DUF3408 domain-containing protein [Dysgonomonas macrotermitis]|uniref:DUF3408 domain-containing protein n=1 Tax=Dysgonomonas macrotermitis TaxID=1346286 RepID=A0A1M5J9W3_9BACT|nr:DUF3408 domain-containing protein [Dysgonomonas macrotermitis]SHG37109.1 Protein of unknown function [Dysgonomonas macrotermitis]
MAKKTEEDIDEDFIIASMNMTGPSALNKVRKPDNIPSQKQEQETSEDEKEYTELATQKEGKESKKRKTKGNYEELFIRPSDITGRQEKTIYLREDHYDRIDKMLKLYRNTKLSVFSYVDAVLEHHFELYKQEMKEIHDKLYKAPYE